MNRNEAPLDSGRFEIEKKELEAVLESGLFAASCNAARLLRFVCNKYFEGAGAVTEYDVALQALGRRPDFDARNDSIVRVEAHRVRKRLQEYYESEGASRAIRIVLPRGTYTPQFVRVENGDPIPAEQAETPAAQTPARKKYMWAAAIVMAAGAAVGAALLWWSPDRQAAPKAVAAAAGPAAAGAVRILAGLDSGEYIDRTGARWQADAYFNGGDAAEIRYHSLALASDATIYRHARVGDSFSYDIPLRPGVYELRLMFADSSERVVLGSQGEGFRTFRVTANGVQILPPPDDQHLPQLDIIADAGGADTADVKVFKDIAPAQDGKLHLQFTGRNQRALLNAIEIVPGLKGKMRPLRWRANETSYMDRSGNLWLSDMYFRGGRLSTFHTVVSGTPDPNLYEGERFGSFAYQIPVVAGGSYSVTMHFAENYFGGFVPRGSRPRLFSVYANHARLLRDFDVYREAGGATKSLSKTFNGVKPNSFDKIVINFEPSTEFAIVNAIQVEDESK